MVLNGRGAVVVFFVLSGYVLTRSLRSTHFDRHSVLHFYGQRAFRIYPAMWAASTLGLLYLVALHWQIRLADGSFGAPGAFRLDRFSPPFIVGSFTGMVTYILPQLWSIHVEILGSLAMPAIAFVALHRRRRALWMLMVMAVAISYLFGSYTIYHCTFLHRLRGRRGSRGWSAESIAAQSTCFEAAYIRWPHWFVVDPISPDHRLL
jgi:peptidoglycan/LPS O-acetylase OafA/YrhL